MFEKKLGIIDLKGRLGPTCGWFPSSVIVMDNAPAWVDQKVGAFQQNLAADLRQCK